MLPTPTGPYRVGRAAYHWVDADRDDPMVPAPGRRRDLLVWIWYPAEPAPGAGAGAYLPPGWEPLAEFWGFDAGAVRAASVPDAEVAALQERYPVLIFAPAGFPPICLSAVVEEIASHGYVVAGVNPTHESTTVFPDGRVVPMNAPAMQPVMGPYTDISHDQAVDGRAAIVELKAADMRFVADRLEGLSGGTDRLAGRIDLTRLGAFGHSMGGNAALELCRRDGCCLAAANLDEGNWTEVGRVGVARPALQVLADHTDLARPWEESVRAGVYPDADWCEAERRLMLDGWQAVHDAGRPGHSAMIRGAAHSFMDIPFLPVEPGSMVAGGLALVRIDHRRAWRVACDLLLAFFARHLAGAPAPLLDDPAAAYPEVWAGPPRLIPEQV